MSQIQSKKCFAGRWSRAFLMSLLAVGAHDFLAASEAHAARVATANVNTRTSVNRNTNVNVNRNTHVNVNRNVNVNVNNRYNPVATGVAVGAAAVVTAAVVGSMVYSLPPRCAPYVHAGVTYQQCGGAYYQPQYSGSSVTYVVVNPPR